MKFETKANGSKEAKLSLQGQNAFQVQVEIQKLQKEGYEVGPYKYKTDFNGLLTKKVEIYRACKYSERKTIYIYS